MLNIQNKKPLSGLAITAFVIGIVAIFVASIIALFFPAILVVVTAYAPLGLAVFGLIFSVIGLAATKEGGKKRGRAFAVVALIICLVAGSVSVASLCSANLIINEAAKAIEGNTETPAENKDLKIGQSIELDDKIKITAVSKKYITDTFTNKKYLAVKVMYENGSDEAISYNMLDWKSESKTGKRKSAMILPGIDNAFDSGILENNKMISGYVFVKKNSKRICFYKNSLIDKEPLAIWVL